MGMLIIKLISSLVMSFLVADLITPPIAYMFYRWREKVWRYSIFKMTAEHITKYTSYDISRIQPPKTIKYLRNYVYVPFKKKLIKYSVVDYNSNRYSNILNKNISKFIDSPLLKLARKQPTKATHNGIIKRLTTKSKQNPFFYRWATCHHTILGTSEIWAGGLGGRIKHATTPETASSGASKPKILI